MRELFLRPTVLDYLPFLRCISVSSSAVWEGLDSMDFEELQRKNAPGVGINRGGQLIDLCYQRCSDDLNVSLFLLAELLDRAINLRAFISFVDTSTEIIPKPLDLDGVLLLSLTRRMREEGWLETEDIGEWHILFEYSKGIFHV